MTDRVPVPRDRSNDYTPEAAAARRDFLAERTGAELEHVGSFSFDPAVLPGNVEHFTGVAQVPIGVAGPLLVDGEHAQDRKSTRLNSSHANISYAVFCLKKKKNNT